MNTKYFIPKKGMLYVLLSKVVKLKWNVKNRKHYEDLGYVFTRYGDEFDVSVEDLTSASKAVVEVECDFCHEAVVKKRIKLIENNIAINMVIVVHRVNHKRINLCV
jgi:hypothetical protein